jgi:hypothetical protein
MANQDDVRRIALSLPGTTEGDKGFAFVVDHKGKLKGFAWVWVERIHPKKPRVPRPDVLAVRVADQADKAALLAADPAKFFTEPHYNGFPAVLVRLPEISIPELRQVLTEGWRCMAPKALVAAYDAGGPETDSDDEPPARASRKAGSRPAPRAQALLRRRGPTTPATTAAPTSTRKPRKPPSRS